MLQKKIRLRSHLTEDEICERLTHITGYDVSVRNDVFNLKRIINYRNSFLPQIEVRFANKSRNQIDVMIKLNTFVKVFLVIWLSFVAFFCIVTIILFLIDYVNKFQIIPFLMLGFGLIIPSVTFKMESDKSEKKLLRLLDAEIIE